MTIHRVALALSLIGVGCTSNQNASRSLDLGLSESISSNTLTMTPAAGASSVARDTAIQFTLDAPKSTLEADVEASMTIQARSGAPVVGTFAWTDVVIGSGAIPDQRRRLTFSPSSPLAADTDYVVTITPTGSFHPEWALFPGNRPDKLGRFRAPLSTGSHLRVASILGVSKDGGTSLSYVRVRFSEPVTRGSALAGVHLMQNGQSVPSLVTDPLKMYWQDPNPIQEIEISASTPVSMASPVVVAASGLTSVSGQALDSSDFDSATAVAGEFEATLDPAIVKSPTMGGFFWYPDLSAP